MLLMGHLGFASEILYTITVAVEVNVPIHMAVHDMFCTEQDSNCW